MAKRLVVLSDMWGSKKGLWITSYLGYLQQYFDIVYHDIRELAALDMPLAYSSDDLHKAFANGGIDRAVFGLMRRETSPAHYLAFCAGGTIAWKAALQGLPVKSLYAISPYLLEMVDEKPPCPIRLVYGEKQENRPDKHWFSTLDVTSEIIPRFGHDLYTDEKIIRKVCMDLLDGAMKEKYGGLAKTLTA